MEESKKSGMGTPIKIAIGCGVLLLCAIICFFIASASGLAGLNQIANEIDKQNEQSKNEETERFNNAAKVNEKVTIGDIEWTLLEAKDMGSTIPGITEYNEDCVAESGKFVFIKFKVKNNQTDLATVSDLDLLDSDKKEFKSSSDVYGCIEGDIFLFENVNPGLEKTFIGVYEVPSTSKGFRIKVGDLKILSNDFKYISLGF